jgi:hypothetical protein
MKDGNDAPFLRWSARAGRANRTGACLPHEASSAGSSVTVTSPRDPARLAADLPRLERRTVEVRIVMRLTGSWSRRKPAYDGLWRVTASSGGYCTDKRNTIALQPRSDSIRIP